MNLQPLKDRVIVRPAARATQTESGIALANTRPNKPDSGEVLAAGPRSSLNIGDRIIFEGDAAVPFPRDHGDLLLIDEDHVMAVVVS